MLKKAAKAERNGRLALWASHYQEEVAHCRPGGEWHEKARQLLAQHNEHRRSLGWPPLVPAAA